MTSNELKELVKQHFSLIEAPEVEATEVNETFGEVKDINGAFTLKFPGDTLEVGDKVTVVTTEGQEMDAPDGYHELADGKKIKTEGSVVTEILAKEDMQEEVEEEVKEEEMVEETKDEEMMEVELEPALKVEDVVKIIGEVVSEEMKKMKDQYAQLAAKFEEISAAPASEKTLPKTTNSKVEKFSIADANNADRINMAIKMLKNKK